jgi:hypothetical protein
MELAVTKLIDFLLQVKDHMILFHCYFTLHLLYLKTIEKLIILKNLETIILNG